MPAQANLLVPFLERESVVDARAVTLKCVEKLFLPAPPANPESVRSIGDRAHTLAMKFLDPEIFGGGEYALLAKAPSALWQRSETRGLEMLSPWLPASIGGGSSISCVPG